MNKSSLNSLNVKAIAVDDFDTIVPYAEITSSMYITLISINRESVFSLRTMEHLHGSIRTSCIGNLGAEIVMVSPKIP